MTENTKFWDMLGRTDPKQTKTFKRAGGFSGTAIKPMWSYRRMTEEFGPCGVGWGVGHPEFQVVPGPEGEQIVYCVSYIWFKAGDEPSERVYGVGGDKAVSKNKFGIHSDDEAFKKAYTDAITNALKMIGVGADVHMGLFDDSKYVNTMEREFAEEPQEPPKSSASLKRDGAWEALKGELESDFADCHSIVALNKLREIYRDKAKAQRWPAAWLSALKNEFDQQEDALKKVELVSA